MTDHGPQPLPAGTRRLLADLLDYGEDVRGWTDGYDRERFAGNDRLFRAVLHNLAMMSRTAQSVPTAFLDAHPDVPWRPLLNLQGVLAQDPARVDRDLAWDLSETYLGIFLIQLRALVQVVAPDR
jgi:uncharacterized protein with HEPN domain